MKWNIIENFVPNVDEHIRLIKALSQDKTIFFVRKETIEFEELEEHEKSEIIEENYELFKEGLLWFDNENTKKMIKMKVLEIGEQIQGLQINKIDNSLSDILNLIEKDKNINYLDYIKKMIMNGILEEYKENGSLFNSENFACTTKNNESHKYYSTNGELESEREYFYWYKIDNIQKIKSFIEQNNYNYNIILTQNNYINMEYDYYINYYEGTEYILAVKDNRGNFTKIFSDLFFGKYLIKQDSLE